MFFTGLGLLDDAEEVGPAIAIRVGGAKGGRAAAHAGAADVYGLRAKTGERSCLGESGMRRKKYVVARIVLSLALMCEV